MTVQALRSQILATSNPRPVPIKNVPQWSGVHVKPLLVGETEAPAEDADPKLQTARGIARILCDASGALIFDVNNAEDLAAINKLPSSCLNHINEAVQAINGAVPLAELGNGSPRETASS